MNFGMKFEVRVESNIKINEDDIDSWSSKWQDIPIFFVKTIYTNDFSNWEKVTLDMKIP